MTELKKTARRKCTYTIASIDGHVHIFGKGFDPEQIFLPEAALAISGDDFRRIHRKRKLEPEAASDMIPMPEGARVLRRVYNNGDFIDYM